MQSQNKPQHRASILLSSTLRSDKSARRGTEFLPVEDTILVQAELELPFAKLPSNEIAVQELVSKDKKEEK